MHVKLIISVFLFIRIMVIYQTQFFENKKNKNNLRITVINRFSDEFFLFVNNRLALVYAFGDITKLAFSSSFII
jgi:hypothetical protein